MNQNSTDMSKDAADRRIQKARTLGLFALLNAVLLTIAIATDQSSSRFKSPSLVGYVLHNYWVIIETSCVFAAVYAIGRMISIVVPRFGFHLAVALTASIPLIWYGDRLARISMQSRLFSSAAMNQLLAFAPFIADYTTPGTFAKIGLSFVAFGAVEIGLFWVARHLTESPNSSTTLPAWLRRPSTIATVSIGALGILLLAVRSPTHAAAIYRAHPQQHPFCMLGIVDLLLPPRTIVSERETIIIEAQLRQVSSQLERLEDRYKNLKIAVPATQPPDIVLIMAESLRYDAIEMPHAPNLCEFRNHAFYGTEHFSGGNATQYGLFTFLSGLDPALMSRARDWPVALPKLLHQAGYFTAHLGSGPYDWMEMTDFLRPEDWDVYRDEFDVFPFHLRDAEYVEHAVALLERKREAADHEGPVCVFVFPYTTHWDYHFAAEDEVHTPSLPGNLWWPPNPNRDLRGLKNRYLNSVHALDRVIKPLLDPNHVVVFLGDHGEAMFDYGDQLVHANSLSPAQTQTPLIVNIPGVQPRLIDEPTSHCDILPTLLDVIGTSVNHPEVFSGQSLLDESRRARRFMLFNSKDKACGLFAPYAKRGAKLNMVQWSNLDLWNATTGVATVHQESGEFKQTLGRVKDEFLSDFDAWLESTLD